MTDWCLDPDNGDDLNAGDSWAVVKSFADGQTYGGTDFRLTSAAGGLSVCQAGQWVAITTNYIRQITEVTNDTTLVYGGTVISAGGSKACVVGGAWKTVGKLQLCALGGDTVRIPKTPDCDAVTAGSLTFTLKSTAVTVPSGRIKIIEQCETGWVAATNVTRTHTPNYKIEGTNQLQLDIAGAFGTGKVAYKALAGATDFSAFQGVSFAFKAGATFTPSCLKVCLCSDATGDTIVDNFTIPAPRTLYANGASVPMFILRDGGGNCGASIQSVAVYAVSDPGTVTAYFDNIIAALDLSSADHLCHRCIISQAAEWAPNPWWGIANFSSDTGLVLTGQFYGGAAGAQSVYRREMAPGYTNGSFLTALTDPCNAPINVVGGYDTATSIRDGQTIWFLWQDTSVTKMFDLNGKHGIGFSWLGFGLISTARAWYSGYYNLYPRFSDLVFTSILLPSGVTPIYNDAMASQTCNVGWRLTRVVATGCNSYFLQTFQTLVGASLSTARDWYLEDVIVYSCKGLWLGSHFGLRGKNIKSSNHHFGVSTDGGLIFDGIGEDGVLANVEAKDNPGSGIMVTRHFHDLRLFNLVTSGNTVASMALQNADVRTYNDSLGEATALDPAYSTRQSRLSRIKAGGVADTHAVTTWFGTIASEASIRHTATGIAWKLSPTNADQAPLRLRLATLAVKAGITSTIGAWFRRSNASLNARLYVPGYQVSGADDEITASLSGSVDTFIFVNLEVTPTEDGVVEVWAEAQGGTTYSLYIDDLSVA